MSEKTTRKLRRGDRVRATQDITMEDYPFVDIRAGTKGVVVGQDMPKKVRSCWRVTIRFDGVDYLVQLHYPTDKVVRISGENFLLPV